MVILNEWREKTLVNIYTMSLKYDFKSFLKKYSSIPNAFIDDFHKVYDRTSTDEFIIDLDVVAKWLNVYKYHLKATLLTSYERDVDYTVTVPPRKGRGRPLEKIMLTADCFKFLCMRSNTEKSQMVRAYYVEMENLLEKYIKLFMELMQTRIDELENNQRPKDYPLRAGFIYVIKASEKYNSVYKLGKSKDLKNRLRSYNGGRMDDVEIVYAFETDNMDDVEKCVKAMLAEKQYRKVKEVYQVDIDIIKGVIQDCSKLCIKTKKRFIKMTKQSGGYYMVFDRTP
mgnify:CR=1 FL=1